uniref:Tectonic family member 1 n=1 Tax=Sinocyclocheilus rhinocerous TaxID=307959 RepID=A0A673NCP0_9TELE
SESPDYFPAPTAWTPESVTAFPGQTESSESSIPNTSPESPRAATAAQPLPLSGVLPAPVTEVSQLCLCKLQNGQCDINCCCDPDCTDELGPVKYTFRYSEAGEILNVIASVLLGAIKSVTVPIQQELQITFLQPVMYPNIHLCCKVLDLRFTGIVQSADPKGSLTFLQNSGDQDCLLGSSRRSPVLFGIDMVSGCTLKLSNRINCSLVSEVILWALKGQSFPDHVASFGNSLPQNPLDWVPIQNQTIASGTQACSIPLSYHLEVKWTKYRTLLNPQAQIMSALLTSADGFLFVTSSVSFVDVSASASPGFKVPPTIDAKLPFDFFFPFV